MCSWVWLGFVENAKDGVNKRQIKGQKQKEQKLVKEVWARVGFGACGV
jgi:hypothetical protein